MRQRLLILLCSCGLLGAAGADPQLSTQASARWASGSAQSGTQLLEFAWQPRLRWRFDNGGRLTGIARLRAQTEPGLRPGDIDRESYAGTSRPALIGDKAELALREFYYEHALGDWYLSIGKQQVVWGKADGLKVLDIVNPQSFREITLEDFDQSRIPQWTLNLERALYDWMGGDWTLQLLWIADQSYHALPQQDATYAFSSPRLVPKAPDGVAVQLNDPVKPDRLFEDSDAGIRLSGFLAGWDLSLNYLYQYNNQPALHRQIIASSSPTAVITPRYHRSHLLGASFSRAFGEWVVRGEAGYFSDRYFLSDAATDTDGIATSSELSYVLGLDWSAIENSFLSVQLFQSWLPEHHAGFTRPELDTGLSLLARRHFRNETLSAELLWIANTDDKDGLLRPSLRYEWQDNIDSWLGADVFYGDRQGLFGQFDSRDRVVLGVKLGL